MFVSSGGSSVVGFVTLGFGVCAGREGAGSAWSVWVMGVMGAVAVFLRYFGVCKLPNVAVGKV